MPYPGIPQDKTAEMERCVNDVMAGKDLKDKYPDHKERKSHAIAICHASIMGTKKKGENMPNINFNFYGDYWKEKVEVMDSIPLTTDKKSDKNQELELNNPIKKDDEGEEVKIEMTAKEEKKVEVKKEETPVVEKAKAGDACKMADGKPGKMAMKDGKMVCMAEEKKADTQIEVKKEEVKVEVKPEVKEEKVNQTADLLKNVIAKLDTLLAKKEDKKVEKADSVPAEGATPEVKEEAPKGGEAQSKDGQTPKEEKVEAKVDASPEGTEKLEKVEQSLTKIDENLGKIVGRLDKVDTDFVSLNDRLTKLEKEPAPSKVVSAVAVAKADLNPSVPEGVKQELVKIDTELATLEEIKRGDLPRYQRDRMWEKAWPLVEKKQALLSKVR